MSYTNRATDPRRRIGALATVVLIHAALGYVLVNGLAYQAFVKVREYTPIFEFKEPPPPPPPPTDEIVPDAPSAPDFIAPQPPLDLTPIAPIQPRPFDPLEIPRPAVIPSPTPNLVERPAPQPSFAPKRAAPRGDTARWVTSDDYPSRALRQGAEGTTHFRLVVGTDGRVDACEVTTSSGDAQLDAAACRNLERRARFEPATDGSGKKVVGTYTNSVTWHIPD